MSNTTETMEALAAFYDEHKDSDWDTWERCAEHYPYALPQNALTFDNVDHARRRITASGSHFYDRDAVRFFRGKTDGILYGRRFWVESKKFEDATTGQSHPREYQVTWAYEYAEHPDGILTVERLGSFDTLDKARRACRALADLVAEVES